MPFDYKFSGGMGARDYYDENNAYTYRWDVQHNIADLISLMGGNEKFVMRLSMNLLVKASMHFMPSCLIRPVTWASSQWQGMEQTLVQS